MDQGTALGGWDDLRPPCGLTGRTIEDRDYVVWFPYFITDREDSFWRYNEWPMLRKAFDEWEHKESFLMRWRESLLNNIVPRVRVLVNQADYLVWLTEHSSIIVLNFLNHGFALSIPTTKWLLFKDFLTGGSWHSGEFHLSNKQRISIHFQGGKIRVTWEPLPAAKGRRDRILLNQSEWMVLTEVVQTIDRALQTKD